ncbi:amidase [Tropicimonas sp. IMCC34011]|uniref:amidase n=1 Tax=Tropicimonas sp. IMCC34011 TaxID=2248759 RepID=UPI0013005739|nr:amidase [Tropicimonas sp. IMCC34011]
MNPSSMTLREAADSIRTGDIGCEELMRACLDRIEAKDGELNAVIAVEAERALERAVACDRTDQGERGALHGIPFGYKDMFHRAGAVSSYGATEAHWKTPDETSVLLGAVETAGGIGCARLNMAEFAMGPTGHNPHFGRCRNPHAPARISGGSSSGSGAAVAAGYVFGALGSDTGGSVRLPASMCGTVGLKPTQYRLSSAGMMPLSPSLDCPGIFAKTCADAARIFDALTGEASEAGLDDPLHARIGVPGGYYTDDLDEDVAVAFESSLGVFRAMGLSLKEADVDGQGSLAHYADVIWKTEAAALHRGSLPPGRGQLGRQVRARLIQGIGIRGTDYVDAARLRTLSLRRFLAGPLAAVDALVMPTVPIMTPLADTVSAEGGEKMRRTLELISRNTRPISFLGLPALSVPMGMDRNGMPMGLQIVGRPCSEALLLHIGDLFARTATW